MAAAQTDVDVLIVGAGISGIGMAAHMQMSAPDQSYAIVERRENLGGTWDLFRYPGIRSDSDMHTLGFFFEPWTHEKSIADAPSILEYLNRIVDERDIRPNIRFGEKVISTDFRREDACWHVEIEASDGTKRSLKAGFLFLGSGYYDYDDPYDAGFDFSQFGGEVLHPQFWPDNLDYTGKKVVVVGSGATAVTIVPAMAEQAEHITMLQRTPTWMISRDARDKFANTLRKFLPEKLAYAITRWKNIRMQDFTYKVARNKPEKAIKALRKGLDENLGVGNYDQADFSPPYNPWEQRLCLVPDADFFEAVKNKKASVKTGHIAGFEEAGVRLESGELIEADIIVTATGLSMAVAGKIAISVEGERVDFSDRFYYMSCMFSNVPNLAGVFGYLNASWTLRSDLVSEYVCRVLNHMKTTGSAIAEPVLTSEAEAKIDEDDIFDFSSGYIQRSKHIMPRNAMDYPWRLSQEYISDRKIMRTAPLVDGCLTFGAPPQAEHSTAEQQLEAAE
ncbi:MAG: NAD(P)/FAD-dependent oxidoreductase [Erythrobacter sp.]